MRIRMTIFLLLMGVLSLSAQSVDSVLIRMNAIKLSHDYIYGNCQMPDEEGARREAFADLVPRVKDSLQAWNTMFVRSLEQCPEGMVKWLVFQKGENYYRALAYVEKSHLMELERELAAAYESKGIHDLIEGFKRRLAEVNSMDELNQAIEWIREKAGESVVKYGYLTSPHDDSYLVYYDRTSGKILLIRTPMNVERKRFDVRSGAVSAPRKNSPNEAIMWVYIDEPKKMKP